MIGFWCLSYAVGLQPLGANPVPNFWGMVIATVALVQLGVGVWLDRHYNRHVGRFYLWAAMYPLFYWMLMLVITVRATPGALFGRRDNDLALAHRARPDPRRLRLPSAKPPDKALPAGCAASPCNSSVLIPASRSTRDRGWRGATPRLPVARRDRRLVGASGPPAA